jgi:hypothetical protein
VYLFHITGRGHIAMGQGKNTCTTTPPGEMAMQVLRDLTFCFGPGEEWRLQLHLNDCPILMTTATSARLSLRGVCHRQSG